VDSCRGEEWQRAALISERVYELMSHVREMDHSLEIIEETRIEVSRRFYPEFG